MKLKTVDFLHGVKMPGGGGVVETFLTTLSRKYNGLSLDFEGGMVTVRVANVAERTLVPLIAVRQMVPDDEASQATQGKK